MRLVLVLSGAVGSGKSTVANAVLASVPSKRLSTRQMILEREGVSSERGALQAAGDELDHETSYSWVVDGVLSGSTGEQDIVIVDAVRRREQIDRLRDQFGDRVRHVHVTASDDELRRRHARRQHEVKEPADYSDAISRSLAFDPLRLFSGRAA